MEKLREELVTIKFMIYSLYKSITFNEDLEELSKWEKECRELAKKRLEKQKNKED